LHRTSSTTSLQKNGSLRRRSVKERAESVDGAKATPTVAPAPKEKLVEVEKAQTGKVPPFTSLISSKFQYRVLPSFTEFHLVYLLSGYSLFGYWVVPGCIGIKPSITGFFLVFRVFFLGFT